METTRNRENIHGIWRNVRHQMQHQNKNTVDFSTTLERYHNDDISHQNHILSERLKSAESCCDRIFTSNQQLHQRESTVMDSLNQQTPDALEKRDSFRISCVGVVVVVVSKCSPFWCTVRAVEFHFHCLSRSTINICSRVDVSNSLCFSLFIL